MVMPNDPLVNAQWHFSLIGNISRIWDEYTGQGVSVVVYDDGVECTHADLAGNYDASQHFRNDGVTYDAMPIDADDSHGTACAGLIGSVGNNSQGGAGVAWDATLTGVNWLNDIQSRSPEIIDAAMGGAVRHHVRQLGPVATLHAQPVIGT
ncbi:MAG: S8 family serine peptidase [Gemmobacter sp.]|nr:S8 family serine peptidase [Gemmobacter sp.]